MVGEKSQVGEKHLPANVYKTGFHEFAGARIVRECPS